jgi:uncharacterized damage-inducible protein DinB
MLIETLKSLFERDLRRVKSEIESYKNEKNLWIIDEDVTNSAGNLCLHLVGNLNHFIGAQLGKTGYVRERELEFSSKDVPRTELLKKFDETITMVNNSFDRITEGQMEDEYPILIYKQKTSNEYFLVHLLTHLNYHLGQINYHRRLLDK